MKPFAFLYLLLCLSGVVLGVGLPIRAATQEGQAAALLPAAAGAARLCPAVYLPAQPHHTFAPLCALANAFCEQNGRGDQFQKAHGPLAPGEGYEAYPDDTHDWYFVRLSAASDLTVTLSGYTAVGQLQLRHWENDRLILKDFAPIAPDGTAQVSLPAAETVADIYYIWVYTSEGANSQTRYTLTATYDVPPVVSTPPPPPRTRLLDDFEDAQTWWTPDPAVFTYTLSSQQVRAGGQALEVVYAKSAAYQFIGREIPAGQRDLTWVEALDIWVHGVVTLSVTLEEAGTLHQQTFGPLAATDPAGWSLLQVDLRGAALDMSRIKSVLLFVAPGEAAATGAFFMDELLFRDRFGLLEDLDRFRYFNWWTPDPPNMQYGEHAWPLCAPMSVVFTKTVDAPYALLGLEVPPGVRDFRWAQVLELWVYGDAPLLVTLEDTQQNRADLGTLSGADPAGWSLLRYNFSAAAGQVDLQQIRNVLIFPYPGNTSAGGTVHLDDVALSAVP